MWSREESKDGRRAEISCGEARRLAPVRGVLIRRQREREKGGGAPRAGREGERQLGCGLKSDRDHVIQE